MSYTGKILRLDLTNRTSSIIDTEPYQQWGGGFGISQAVFWDECEDVTVGGFDPKNVLVIATNPMTGTLAPSVGNKIEMTGIQVYSYPKEYYTRTNCGQFVGPMLKRAGWDGIVIKGEASSPVWVNIINDKVVFEDASDLWGKDTHYTQKEIWRRVTGRKSPGEWASVA
ncbi:MAG: aldehyde:ferredoxin oxidoreductase, partial [Dehalococcoidales bacterium]|nr:aldehyde:ferredoxin oxidoreductase [Dehalococcoidales bacterium]